MNGGPRLFVKLSYHFNLHDSLHQADLDHTVSAQTQYAVQVANCVLLLLLSWSHFFSRRTHSRMGVSISTHAIRYTDRRTVIGRIFIAICSEARFAKA
jgi:hypothetical protein